MLFGQKDSIEVWETLIYHRVLQVCSESNDVYKRAAWPPALGVTDSFLIQDSCSYGCAQVAYIWKLRGWSKRRHVSMVCAKRNSERGIVCYFNLGDPLWWVMVVEGGGNMNFNWGHIPCRALPHFALGYRGKKEQGENRRKGSRITLSYGGRMALGRLSAWRKIIAHNLECFLSQYPVCKTGWKRDKHESWAG